MKTEQTADVKPEPLPADRVFGERDGTALLGRLYLPQGEPPAAFVVEVHGGGWCSGDRHQNAAICALLAGQGIAVFAVDFRMPPAHRYPAAIADVALALQWLQAEAPALGGTADRIGLLGFSSGAHLAALVALDPAAPPGANATTARPCAFWVGCWPVVDPLARFQMAQQRGRDDLVQNHHAFWADEAEMAAGNPQRLVDAGRFACLPPALLLQGSDDDNVDPAMTARFADSYRAAGGAAELLTFAGEPHAFMKRNPDGASSRAALAAIVRFVRAHGAAQR